MSNLYGIKDSANFTMTSKRDGKVVLYSNYTNSFNQDWSSERVFAKSKGVEAIAWDSAKKGTLTVETEVFSLKLIAMLAGTEINESDSLIQKTDFYALDDSRKIKLGNIPVEETVQLVPVDKTDEFVKGDEYKYIATEDGQEAPVLEEKQFTVTNGEIIVGGSVEIGTRFMVVYQTLKEGSQTFMIEPNKFAENFAISADTMIRSTDGVDDFVNWYYPNAKPQANFSITNSATEPTTLSIVFDLLPDRDIDGTEYNVKFTKY